VNGPDACRVWRAPLPDADDAVLRATYEPCKAQTIVYGHIHRPYVRRVGQLRPLG
jgi:predicted phosphodiesterase